MIRVERGNVILDIKPENLDYYMSLGYSQVDDKGNVIKKAIPTTIEELRKAYIENQETIEKLQFEIKKLTKKSTKTNKS